MKTILVITEQDSTIQTQILSDGSTVELDYYAAKAQELVSALVEGTVKSFSAKLNHEYDKAQEQMIKGYH